MSDRDNPRSLVEIMNDVLSTVREHYDSEYVYYIEKEYEDIDVIYEHSKKHAWLHKEHPRGQTIPPKH